MISILIVNWNSRDLLRKCLTSISSTCSDLSLQIVVVDGGSFDGCGEMLASDFPEVEFLQSQDNLGFGRANNLGLGLVKGEITWILNPDTELQPGALQTLIRELERLPDAGIVSPRFLNTDMSPQVSVHSLPRPIRQALDSELLRTALWPLRLWAPPGTFAPATTTAVEAVAGTGMLIRTEVFRRIGAFTPVYFMYAEDMDLCFKIRSTGLRIYYVPDAIVIHHGGASSSFQGNSFSAVMMCDALHSYMVLNRGRASAGVYKSATGVAALVRMLLRAPGLLIGGERHQHRRLVFLRWWAVLCWSCGGQRWTRKYALPVTHAVDGG